MTDRPNDPTIWHRAGDDSALDPERAVVVGETVHRALDAVDDYGSLYQVIGVLEGRYGRPSYRTLWKRISGDPEPDFGLERAVVDHLLRVRCYDHIPIDEHTVDLRVWAAAYDDAVRDFPSEMASDEAKLSWLSAMLNNGRRNRS